MKFVIYTDGACSGNPGPGGWGAVILNEEKKETHISGKEKNTTNNRMELVAPIMALRKIRKASKITIYTDSTYLKNGITTQIKNWEKNSWKKSNGIIIQNLELIKKLYGYYKEYKIKFKHIKAHKNEPAKNDPSYNDWYGNMMADLYATNASKNI